jgi:hypothetical protein
MVRLLLSCLIILLPADNLLKGYIPTEIGLLTRLNYLQLGKSSDHKVISIAYFACFSIISLSETTKRNLENLHVPSSPVLLDHIITS